MDRSVDLDLLHGCYRRGISPVPATATRRALELAGDDLSNDELLISQIESNPQLRFGFMAVANLPMFCGSRPIKTVRQGVGALGRRKTLSLFWLLAVSEFLQSPTKREDENCNRLWRHSLLTGILARQFSLAAGFEFQGDVFTAGLVHDIGHHLLAHSEPRLTIASQDENGHEEGDRLLENTMSQAPERDHCQLGASLLEFWNAPAELAACALDHHDPVNAKAEYRPLIAGVRMADLLADHLDINRPIRSLRLEAAPAWQQLASMEPWKQVAGLHRIALAQLPEALLASEHLADILGG